MESTDINSSWSLLIFYFFIFLINDSARPINVFNNMCSLYAPCTRLLQIPVFIQADGDGLLNLGLPKLISAVTLLYNRCIILRFTSVFVNLGFASVNNTFEGWLIMVLTEKEHTN